MYPEDASDLEGLQKNADQAMYVAKNAGRNRFSYFTSAMQEAAHYRLNLLNELRVALPEKQLQLYYQPIIELTTGKLRKAEALLRWFHPKRGLISPAEFIPLAEDSGLIHDIGDWVFAESLRQAKHWRSTYIADLQISVNMSPVELQTRITHNDWQHHLTQSGMSGAGIVVEITEGLLLDTSPHVTSQLLAFRDAGVQVAIDDFGTGYSALSYLKKLDIDYVKIDQSFIRNLVTDTSDMALTEAMIVMAHKLGLQVIAEGVETAQQRDLLAGFGCDFVQGYLYSRPVAAEEFERLLGNSKNT
jgi:EAL domain-containing protein (putative c-di-GMP-specific phosphodiesterase class I)